MNLQRFMIVATGGVIPPVAISAEAQTEIETALAGALSAIVTALAMELIGMIRRRMSKGKDGDQR